VAVHVCGSGGCGLDEADVLVECVPARGLRPGGGGEVEPDGVGTVLRELVS
jgi:hypothetical protein